MCKRRFFVVFSFSLFLFTIPAIASKSVFVISSQDYPTCTAKVYRIDANHVTFQTTTHLPAISDGAITFAVWPQKSLLFTTYDYSSSITWSSTKTLVKLGEYTDSNVSGNFAGIAVDAGKGKIYVAQRQTSSLYVYKWNDVSGTIEPNGVHVLAPITNMYGLALDEVNSRLYVSDNTNTIRYYNTTTWALAGSFNIVVDSNQRPAVGIAVDPNRGYLYTGGFPDGYSSNTCLVRTLTASPHTSIETEVNGNNVIGIDVDRATGLVYCTTTGNDFRVYSSALVQQDIKTDIGQSGGLNGPAGLAVVGDFTGRVHNLTKDTHHCMIQDAVDDANDDNIFLVDEGTYCESVDLGSKSLTIRSGNPADKSVVTNTIVQPSSGYAGFTMSSNGDSTINGLTIREGYRGINCSNSTVQIFNCLIDCNNASAGVYASNNSTVNIVGCEIYRANYTGIYADDTDANVSNCVIDGNDSSDYGIYASKNLWVRNCRIENNVYDGIYAYGFTGSLICANSRIHDNGDYGINCCYPRGTSDILDNCIYKNATGIYVFNDQFRTVTIRNNTVANNSTYGISICYTNDPTTIKNCIVWGNGSNSLTDNIANATNVTYSCVPEITVANGNIRSDPCFVNTTQNDFHLKSASLCKNACSSSFYPLTGETDIDGDSRKIGTAVDMGSDEYALENFFSLRGFIAAWLTRPGDAGWNPIYNFISDANEIINFKDYAVLASHWSMPTGWNTIFAGVGMAEYMPDVNDANSAGQPPPGSPVIYLVYDGNMTPDPNTEVTVYVHTDVPLRSMTAYATVTGDANLTSAMSIADCNQYGWEPEWSNDPYIDDTNGLVGIGGAKWGLNSNTTVGYFKFIYHSGQVSVAITIDSFAYDANSQLVTFSTDPLIIGGESMQGGQQQAMMGGTAYGEAMAVDSSSLTQQQEIEQPVVDINALVNWAQQVWLEDAELRATTTEEQWQQFIDSIKSSR